jgi:hypothetical protein
VAEKVQPATLNIGFLTVLHDPGAGFVGGYLVTNSWGRPLEFRLSTAVQPNRVQQVLYGKTLQPYVCADLIGKTLVEKTNTVAQLIVTDRDFILDLRKSFETPVACIGASDEGLAPSENDPAFSVHASFPEDNHRVRNLLRGIAKSLDLAEPFVRIREAVSEARKMGVTTRG